MAISNRDRVGRAFEKLAGGLEPFVDFHMSKADSATAGWAENYGKAGGPANQTVSKSDPAFLLRVITECWDTIFRPQLERSARSVVFELRDARNRWAHNEKFGAPEAYRILDSIRLLLEAVDATEADPVREMQDQLGRVIYEAEEKRSDATASNVLDASPKGLKPWREVIFPHDDVTEGRFNVAEFAADLHLVREGEGRDEYKDPVEFFRRTYLTGGLRGLLLESLRRVGGDSGPAVVNLQTNFGGGKTHSLIALYQLFSGVNTSILTEEVRSVVEEAGLKRIPITKRAVIVGNKFPAGEPSKKPDGTIVNTLWGELAWQLGEADGYALLAESDRNRTNPGDLLRKLIESYTPCLVLIDEWVAYARDLYEREGLPGGSFDTQFSFAQSLTESVRAVDGALLVVAIPASEPPRGDASSDPIVSDLEVGGAGGREALRRLTNVISRQAEHWRPASADESFEIVRRRLFKPLSEDAQVDRDAAAEAFGELYRRQRAEFPSESSQLPYVARIKAAYPIHPELFDRLYLDWSTLERFQRTRGVLRLMAAVIHALWISEDQSPLILPASVPLDDGPVIAELTRHLEDNWKPVIDADVDGPESRPVQLDRQFQNVGRHHATRRVARTIFLGSAPTARSPNRGIDVQRIRLGSCFPAEQVAVFGDALNRLSDQAPHLYVERSRYWFDLQENVNRTATEEADRLLSAHMDEVHAGIVSRLNEERSDPGEFRSVHVAPRATDDVPDEASARLVILGPDSPHISKAEASPALDSAQKLLENRGSSPRIFRNMLVFAAADQRRLDDLERAVAEYMAWERIDDEAVDRNLDPYQSKQAKEKRRQADEAVRIRLVETYQWALVPVQPDPGGSVTIDEAKLDSQGSLGARVSGRLINDGSLMTQFPPALLRDALDTTLSGLWEDGHVSVTDLWDVFARYVYLRRLRDVDVLVATAQAGPASTTWESDGFATALEFNEASRRYVGLVGGSHPGGLSANALVVRPETASEQIVADRESAPPVSASGEPPVGGVGAPIEEEPGGAGLTRFHGSVHLSPDRVVREFGQVAQEVIQNLTSLVGCDVEIVVEVEARKPDGFEEEVVRTVTENSSTLKFDEGSGFESGG